MQSTEEDVKRQRRSHLMGDSALSGLEPELEMRDNDSENIQRCRFEAVHKRSQKLENSSQILDQDDVHVELSVPCEKKMEPLPKVELYRSAAWYHRIDILPFALMQLLLQGWAWQRIIVTGSSSNDKILTILVAVIPLGLAIHLLTFLSTRWSVFWKCWITLDRCESLKEADWALVSPVKHGGKPGLVQLVRGELMRSLAFEFQKRWYIHTECGWTPLESPYIGKPLFEYAKDNVLINGLSSRDVEKNRINWGANQFDIPDPTFLELFEEHYLAPFFVFQVLCCILWSLDEYWLYSALTLFMLLVFEATLCVQRFRSLDQLRGVKRPPSPIYVYRGQSWQLISTAELVVGDVASLSAKTLSVRNFGIRAGKMGTMSKEIPCDCIVLRGSCVVNEAMLTGESVPQRKDSIIADLDTAVATKPTLELDRAHRRYVVFGGSDLLDSGDMISDKANGFPRPPDHGAIVHVVRTGSETSKGKLVRTILYATERVVGSRDSFAFIAVLLACAILASAYVLRQGLKDPDRNRFKLWLHAVLIVTSVVPPELPMELSLAVTNSLQALVKHLVFCTEPFRIAFAGAVDVCCFDKTGTLTRDELILRSVRCFESNSQALILVDATDLKRLAPSALRVLASCHSLLMLSNGDLVGDSMEKAQFSAIEANINGKDRIVIKQGKKNKTLRIIQRFAFASELRRMSCVVQEDGTSAVWIVCKGAPEAIRSLLKVVPDDYDDLWRSDAGRGDRVLALAIKRLSKTGGRILRADAERELELCGFAAFSSPLKFGTERVISQLVQSGHRCIMITGDGALTAVHVARLVGIAKNKFTAVLVPSENETCIWRDARTDEKLSDEKVVAAAIKLQSQNFDLVIRGDGLANLHDVFDIQALCELACVFARVAPDQKEDIVAALNKSGHTTLMCGDGTNDVSALKRAHVGVSIINSPNLEHRLQKEADSGIDKDESEKHSRLANFEMDAVDADPTLVELGDASIASPFTSKRATIDCVLAIIRQGRCTLVNMIQVFKVLALMCLQSAYVLSTLYLNGIKQGDTQMTVIGLMTAAFFFLMSRAQPLDTLANRRPPRRVFDLKPALSIVLQFIVHISALLATLRLAAPFRPGSDISASQLNANHVPDGPFYPNVVNTVEFVLSAVVQVNIFATNYQGHPFMQALTDHKPLAFALALSYLLLVIVATDAVPWLTTTLQLVPAPTSEFKRGMLKIFALDTGAAWALSFLFH